jgi:hypothetical protein
MEAAGATLTSPPNRSFSLDQFCGGKDFNLTQRKFQKEEFTGITQGYKNAAEWYRKAAEYGDLTAHIFLGDMHIEGRGVEQDYALAHMHFNIVGEIYESAIENRENIEEK